MAAATTIPLTISPEADAFITEVGQRREFEAMLEHARQVVPGLRAFEVELHDFPETGPPGVVIWAHRDDPGPGDDPTHWNWRRWKGETFSPEVCLNFALLSIFHADGR
ncbi:MAG TPA: hypothetical protein VF590_21160 [Isosphaeraceae bacterium]|jgi:hypothetical protein